MNSTPESSAPRVGSSALFGLAAVATLPPDTPAQNEIIGPGTCDFCGEDAPALKVFNLAPVAGACYCRKCAPLSETDGDWPSIQPEPASDIERDVRCAIIRMRVAIESAERHMSAKTRPPMTVCFCLWSDLRKIEALLKTHDPKPNSD